LGGLSAENRIFYVRAVFEESLAALIVGMLILSLRRSALLWSGEIALSLLFAIPAEAFVSSGGMLFRVTPERVLILMQALLVPFIVWVILVIFFVWRTSLIAVETIQPQVIPRPDTRQRIGQRILSLAMLLAYLLACAYGWNQIRDDRRLWGAKSFVTKTQFCASQKLVGRTAGE
jgi:hypothetical protein